VFLIVLMFAELASQYPYAGCMYEWPRILAGRHVGWWIGWLWLFAGLVVTAGTYFVVALVAVPLFGIADTTTNLVICALVGLGVAGVLNATGIAFLGRLSKVGVISELVIMVGFVTLVLIFGHGPIVNLVNTAGTGPTFGKWLPAVIAGGAFIPLFVLYLFENSGTLGEETIDAHRNAPRAILGTFFFAFLIGGYFLFVFNWRIPSIAGALKSASPPLYIIDAALPHWFAKVYLILVGEIALLAGEVNVTTVSRQIFAMGRKGQLPFSGQLSKTSGNGTPWVAVLVVVALSAIPFSFISSFATLGTGATAAMYVTYVGVLMAMLYARLRYGWPDKKAPLALGRWGLPLNVAALIGAIALLVNLVWFRAATDPYLWLHIPVAIWLIGAPVVIGLIYYAAYQRRHIGQPEPAPQTAISQEG
jgi:amino acid transporter